MFEELRNGIVARNVASLSVEASILPGFFVEQELKRLEPNGAIQPMRLSA